MLYCRKVPTQSLSGRFFISTHLLKIKLPSDIRSTAAPDPQGSLAFRRRFSRTVSAWENASTRAFLTFNQIADARAFDRRDMNKHILRAVLRLNKAVSLLGIEPFYGSDGHCRPFQERG